MKMSFSVLFLVVGGFAVSQAASVGDLKNGNRQLDTQVTIPTVLENSSLKSMQESLRAAHMKLQANQIEGSEIRNEKHLNEARIQSEFHSQDLQSTGAPLNRDQSLHQARGYAQDQSMFQSGDSVRDQSMFQSGDSIRDQSMFQNGDSFRGQSMFQSQRNPPLTTTTISSMSSGNDEINGELSYQQQMNQRKPDNQQIFNSNIPSLNKQQFYDDKQQATDQQQFYNSRQQSPNQQQLFATRQQSSSQQQLIFPTRQNSPSQQQFYNLRPQEVSQQQQIYHPRDQTTVQQQQLFNAGQQPQEHQKIYSNIQTMDINGQRINLNDQRINLNHQFQGVSVQQSQIRSERPLILSQDAITQTQSKGVISKGVQLSAFDNREQGLVLPPASVRSSVIVSGLRNLPMLPAMVYNGGPVPSAHAFAYGRDGYYKGSAALSQQLQTPYVRYVYSHIL